jgi:hypothetical protein
MEQQANWHPKIDSLDKSQKEPAEVDNKGQLDTQQIKKPETFSSPIDYIEKTG